jgi:hypothetical protein
MITIITLIQKYILDFKQINLNKYKNSIDCGNKTYREEIETVLIHFKAILPKNRRNNLLFYHYITIN